MRIHIPLASAPAGVLLKNRVPRASAFSFSGSCLLYLFIITNVFRRRLKLREILPLN